jgi:anthranilate synthase component 2
MKTALIDFRDSFTYNIVHYLEALGMNCEVLEDGKYRLEDLAEFEKIVLSPGPGLPGETFSMRQVLEQYSEEKHILGICLGMQGIAEFYGAKIFNLGVVKHGVSAEINFSRSSGLFEGISSPFKAGLYHSWACDIAGCNELLATSWNSDNVVMSFEHKSLPVFGVQFHPESILTPSGKQLLRNFVNFGNSNINN